MQNWLSWRDWGRLLEERLQAEHTALARDTGWQAVGRWRWQSELKPRTQTSRVSLGALWDRTQQQANKHQGTGKGSGFRVETVNSANYRSNAVSLSGSVRR